MIGCDQVIYLMTSERLSGFIPRARCERVCYSYI